MKHFIILITIAITISALAQPVTARDTWDTEREAGTAINWGGEYNAALAQPVTVRDIRDAEHAIEIIRNWGGEYD